MPATNSPRFKPADVRQFAVSLPRPVQLFIGLALVCLLVKSIRTETGGAAQPIADAVGAGLQSVLRENKNKNQIVFFSADLINDAKTVEIRNFSAGLLSGVLSGSIQRVGGKAYFHHYDTHGVQIDGGPLDLLIPDEKFKIRGEEKGKMIIEGTLLVDGQDAPVPVQFVYWITDTDIGLVMGSVLLHEKRYYLKGDDYDLLYQ